MQRKGIILAGGSGTRHHARCFKTAAADLRQADDLLSDFGVNAGWHPRDFDYLYPGRFASV